jgi:hypothetical protein
MKYIYLFLLLYSLAITVNAQSNYKQGYIITNKNDTIRGLIDFRTDKINCSVCKFKLSEEANEQIFHSDDILGYRFINEMKYYVSRTVILNKKTEKVFLEYLVQGMKDLYYYPEGTGYFFFEDEDGKMLSITKEEDKIVDNKYITDNKFRGMLNYIFRDCQKAVKNINRATFERSTMIEITKKYHKEMCSPGQECIVFENNYKKTYIKIDFELYGGLHLMDFSFKNPDYAAFNPAKYLSPLIGGQVCISSPRLNKSFSLDIDASLSKIEGKNDIFKESKDYECYYIKNQFSGLINTESIGLKYTYSKGLLRPTIEAGFSYSFLFNSSNSFYTESRILEKLVQETVENYLPLPNSFLGYKFGVGINYQLNKEHAIFCRISFNKMLDTAANITGAQIRFGYAF